MQNTAAFLMRKDNRMRPQHCSSGSPARLLRRGPEDSLDRRPHVSSDGKCGKASGPRPKSADGRLEPRFRGSGGLHRGPETGLEQVVQATERGVACSFGATCVGTLLERMRLHLGTQRFLAERRGDWLWEASCDYAALALERMGSRLRPGMFEQPLFAKRLRAISRTRVRRNRSNARQKPQGPATRSVAGTLSYSSARVRQRATTVRGAR